MNIETFGYRGEFVFTAPTVTTNSTEELLIFATPFGSREDLEDSLSEFLNEFDRQSSDLDSTTPYQKLTCFNDYENLLYTSTQFLNDYMYSHYNKEKLTLGCDFFCILQKENQIYFTQIGHPLIAMKSENEILPISSDYSFRPKVLNHSPYLPISLLGTESSINIKVQQLSITKETELLLIKSNESQIKEIPNAEKRILIADQDSSQGLWLSRVTF